MVFLDERTKEVSRLLAQNKLFQVSYSYKMSLLNRQKRSMKPLPSSPGRLPLVIVGMHALAGYIRSHEQD